MDCGGKEFIMAHTLSTKTMVCLGHHQVSVYLTLGVLDHLFSHALPRVPQWTNESLIWHKCHIWLKLISNECYLKSSD